MKPGSLIAILFTLALVGNWVWPGFGFATSQQQEVRDDGRAVSVSAMKLFAAYEADDASADQTYKGTIVRVTGNVDRVGNDPDDPPYVMLLTNAAVRRVLARFPEASRGQLARLYRRQWITVLCRVDGQQTDVLLSRCRLENNQ